MKNHALALAVVVVIVLQMLIFSIPSAEASVERLLAPTDDAWVDDEFNREANHGGDSELWVGRGMVAVDRAYLKFNLSSIPSEATIMAAVLVLRMTSTEHTEARDVGVYYCGDDSWSEHSIKGSNAPTYSSTPSDTRSVDDVWKYEWTVTDDVHFAFWKNQISFVVKWVDETGIFGDDYTKKFNSKEAATDNPFLRIRYSVNGDSVDAVSGATPAVDGTIAGAEWEGASSLVFAVADAFEITCYLMQDGSKLFMALHIPDAKPWGSDGIVLLIDTDNDNATPPQPDDRRYTVYRNGTSSREVGDGAGWVEESSTGWVFARTLISAGWQIEFSFSYTELSITAGVEKTLGFHVYSWDLDEFGQYDGYGTWPYEGDASGDIVSVPPHWIPELIPWAPLLLVFIVVTVAIATERRLLKAPIR